MSFFKRLGAAAMAVIMALQFMPLTFAYGEESITEAYENREEYTDATDEDISEPLSLEDELVIESISDSDVRMSEEYLDKYRIETDKTKDEYISDYYTPYGQYYLSYLKYAFDNDWSTHWETGNGKFTNYVDVTFNRAVDIDRIIYATRQDVSKGKGYPTTLTIYRYVSSTDSWEEVAAGKSEMSRSYVIITLPETTEFERLRFEFTEVYDEWASASEFVFLRNEDRVLAGNVSVKGTAAIGKTLTAASNITWGPDNEKLSYRWQYSDDGESFTYIEGADENTYTITENRAYYRAVVTDSTGEYYGSIESGKYGGSIEPEILGQAAVGSVLTAKTKYADKSDLTYRWQYSDDNSEFYDIKSETNAEYSVSRDMANKYVRVAVSGNGRDFVYSESMLIGVRAVMTGSPQAGSRLTGSLMGSGDEVSYIWQRGESENGDFADIEGADSNVYSLTSEDVGKYIRVKITLKDTGTEFISEPWKIAEEGTFEEFTGDYVYLSDLPENMLLSHSVGYSTLKYDTNITDETISLIVNGKKKYFTKGLGAHATAELVYDVAYLVENYQYDRFRAYLGVDAGRGYNGNVKFTVSVSEDNQIWNEVMSTGVLKGNSEAVYADISLKGVKYLKIYIDDNGSDSNDHTVIAGAKLSKGSYTEDKSDYDFIKTVSEYDALLAEYGTDYPSLVKNKEYVKLLHSRTFVNNVGYELLQAYAHEDDKSREALQWFLNDAEALDMYINGGEPEGGLYSNSVRVLIRLYKNYWEDMGTTLYKRMLITISLTHATSVYFWADESNKSDPVKRYEVYKRLYENGYLINSTFENLNVEEMRWVMNNIIDDSQMEWLNFYVRKYYYNNMNARPTANDLEPGPYHYITYTFGYDYSLGKYYSDDNKEMWFDKYHLANRDNDTDDDNYILNVPYESGHTKLWTVFEEGAVCGGISKTGVNLLAAFGVPGVVVGQPGHAAYLRYKQDDPDKGAEAQGRWEIWNDISGWAESAKAERMLAGWGSHGNGWSGYYRGSYALLAQAALNDEENYKTAENLVRLAEMNSSNPKRAIEIYRDALEVQSINMDAWVGLVSAYKDAGKSDSEFADLAAEMCSALTYYPLPMWEISQNLIRPEITDEMELSRLMTSTEAALMAAKEATEEDTLQPVDCRTMANYILGNNDVEIATFSFDGDTPNTIKLSDIFASGNIEFLYSLDCGNKWNSAGTVSSYTLTDEEAALITAENDIYIKLQGSSNTYKIDITTGEAVPQLYNNDNENRITGNISGLEWSYDGTEWNSLTNNRVFEGDVNIYVRRKATGTVMAGEASEFEFTDDSKTSSETRSYIKLDRIGIYDVSSEQTGSGNAENLLDGNIYTMWHNSWSGNDSKKYVTLELDEPVYLTSIDYTPRQTGDAGIVKDCEVYTSVDGVTWVLSGSASGWAVNKDKKTVNMYSPVYAKYVKFAAKATSQVFASAALIELFEDMTYADRVPVSISFASEPDKTNYVKGDKLDTTGMSVMLNYEDGTSTVINPAMLTFSKSVFDTVGKEVIKVSYTSDLNTLEFEVNVGENNKTPNGIIIEEKPEKLNYFAGDTLDTEGLVVKARYTDNSEGYIFEGEYSVTPEKLTVEGTQEITVKYMDFTAIFDVQVKPVPSRIEITALPEKQQYSIGESFDGTGMEVSIVYEKGTREVLGENEYNVEHSDFSKQPGNKNITVSLNAKPSVTAEFSVLVYPYITAGYLNLEVREGTYECYVTGYGAGSLPENVVIPETVTVKGVVYTVTGVAGDAFWGADNITSVSFPKTIKTIEADAFRNCMSLTRLYFIESTDLSELVIEAGAFADDDPDRDIGGFIYVIDSERGVQIEGSSTVAGIEGKFSVAYAADSAESIIITPPLKNEYNLGESLDTTGLTVKAVMENGDKPLLSSDTYSLRGFESDTSGKKIITVSVTGTELKGTFEVSVVPAAPVVTRQPKSYFVPKGGEFTPLTVTAVSSDSGLISYQWYKLATGKVDTMSDTLLRGETSSSYTPNEEGYYYAAVSNSEKGSGINAVTVYTNVARVMAGDYEAGVGNTAYTSLSDAIKAAPNGGTVQILKNIELEETLNIDKSLTLTSHEGVYTVTRSDKLLNGYMLNVTGGNLTIENVIFDGGADWTGDDGRLGRGTFNSGLTAERSIASVSSGVLNMEEGAVFENNHNSSGYGNAGGAAVVNTGGILKLNGGIIRNNSCDSYGGALILLNSGEFYMKQGSVTGNFAGNSGGAICADHSSKVNVEGGTFSNNATNTAGGAIWFSNGTGVLKGEFTDNYANNGALVYINGSAKVSLEGGNYKGNTASRGQSVYFGNGTLNIGNVESFGDTINLPTGKIFNITADISGRSIKVVPVADLADMTKIANVSSEEFAKRARVAINIDGYALYAEGKEIYANTPKENDINGDGIVNAADIAELLKYISGIDVSYIDMDKADINADGEYNILDVIALWQYINKN